jgi:hypothetical protein
MENMEWLRKTIQNLKRNGIKIWSPNRYYYYMNRWYQKKLRWKCDAGDLYYSINCDGTIMLCEEIGSDLKFEEIIKLNHRKRVKILKKLKFEYCDCFKPCYWNPSNFVKYPIQSLLFNARFG